MSLQALFDPVFTLTPRHLGSESDYLNLASMNMWA